MALTEEELEAIADRVAKKMRKSEKGSDENQKSSKPSLESLVARDDAAEAKRKKKLSPTEASFLTGMIQNKPKGKGLDA